MKQAVSRLIVLCVMLLVVGAAALLKGAGVDHPDGRPKAAGIAAVVTLLVGV